MDKFLAALNSIPATAWTAFGTALIAFFGVWVTNRNNRQSLKMQLEHDERLQRQRLAKERLEELYTLVSQWSNVQRMHTLKLKQLVQGRITNAEYAEFINAPENKSDINRIEMIVGMYGAQLQQPFDEFQRVKEDMGAAGVACFEALKKSVNDTHLIYQLEENQPLLLLRVDELKKEIVKAAKEV